MDLPTVVTHLNLQLDSWCYELSCFCPMNKKMDEYRQTSNLIKACGHDTRELDEAIIGSGKAFELLKAACKEAVDLFKAKGVCYTVNEGKRKELEAARLQ
jgi:hypothetical protein